MEMEKKRGNSATQEHLELASYVKEVHHELRRDAANLGFPAAWEKHCSNKTVLDKYAASMASLAQEHWDPNAETDFAESRIEWVRSHARNYFEQGGLQNSDEIEVKKMIAYTKNTLYKFKGPSLNINSDKKLKLLDVGSCYNPFSKFPEFDVLAVDIAPGHPTVKKCDFINVNIDRAREIVEPVTSLPANFFDLVVFSLLLEYFPSKEARYKCCENAYQVLKPGGILAIITPDSKHATANAPLMRQWRVSLATLGFWRVVYEKLHHLHCMMFRKACDTDFPKVWATRELSKLSSLQHLECPSQMMAIPQDDRKFSPQESSCSTEKVEAQTDLFDELPNEYSD